SVPRRGDLVLFAARRRRSWPSPGSRVPGHLSPDRVGTPLRSSLGDARSPQNSPLAGRNVVRACAGRRACGLTDRLGALLPAPARPARPGATAALAALAHPVRVLPAR